MKKFVTLTFLCLFVVSAWSQTTVYNYKFSKAFPDTGFKFANAGHGIAVDPEGKVWIQAYNATDSIFNGVKNVATRVIYCYKPDGTPASFSPIKMVTVAGKTDTLFNSNRGMVADKNGNIVFASFDTYYRLNYKTGVGMNKVVPQTNATAIAPAFDDANEMFTGLVITSAGPIRIFDGNFASLGTVVDTARGYSRSLGVSADGNDVYWTSYTQPGVIRYHSNNGSLGPYSKIDTIMFGLKVESIMHHPKTKYLWVSSGNGFAPSGRDSLYTKYIWSDFTWYAFKLPITKMSAPVDSFKWSGSTKNDPRPRGIAFSPTGDTAYVCQFNDVGSPIAQRFIGKAVVSVQREDGIVATDYQLSQNYPNPFNPTTNIRFSLPVASSISLKVYDVLGKEIANLAEGAHVAGSYTVDFNASNLTSGVYFYTLRTSTGFVQTSKMLLMK